MKPSAVASLPSTVGRDRGLIGIAAWCHRHAAVVIVIWLVSLILLAGVLKKEGRDYTDGFSLPGTDSAAAQQLLAGGIHQPGSGDNTIVFHLRSGASRLTDPAIRNEIETTLESLSNVKNIAVIRSPFAATSAAQISSDGRTAYATVGFTKPDQNLGESDIEPLVRSVSPLRSNSLDVEFGGGAFQSLKGSPLSGSIGIGLAAAAVVLFLAFGSLLAMLIPLAAAIIAVGAGIQTVGLLSHVISFNAITPQISALVGIGVAIDYALFVVIRHRNALRAGLSVEASTLAALNTAGRAVMLAGSTVAIAMLGLLTLGVSFLSGVGIAAALVVGFSVLASITLLPALFRVLGLRILSRRERRRLEVGEILTPGASGGWARWSELVQRRPLWLSGAALLVMLVLLIPTFSIRLGSSDQGNDPSASTTRKAYDLLANGFGPGSNGPLLVVAKAPDTRSRASLTQLIANLHQIDDVASVAASAPTHDVVVINVIPKGSPQAASTGHLITTLRDHVIPAAEHGTNLAVYVGGQTAVFQDFASVLGAKLPLFLTVVVLLGCLLLMVAFRSVVIPLTAAVMNVLAAGAAFGVVVAVFQWGWGSDALGLGKPGPIESFLPVMLIAILFGLSMDYQVFLVSRIQEEWVRTRDTAAAIRRGQTETGRVITAAAAIMVVVFLAFLLEGRRQIGEFGLGLAAAILLDALILRTVLVPAAMHLLGRRNWWLPSVLERALPHIRLEDSESERTDDLSAATALTQGTR